LPKMLVVWLSVTALSTWPTSGLRTRNARMTLHTPLLPTRRSHTAGFLNLRFVFSLSALVVCTEAVSESVVDLPVEEITRAAIGLINFASAPGLTGATFRVDDAYGENADLVRGSLGGGFDVTLRDSIADLYLGAEIGVGDLENDILVNLPAGGTVPFLVDWEIVSLRGSAGLTLPITPHLKVRPYASLIYAEYEAEPRPLVDFDPDTLPPNAAIILKKHRFDATSLGLTTEALYDRWWDKGRLELGLQYSGLYTNTFDESNPVLEAAGWSQTLVLAGRWSDETGWEMAGRPWRWNVYGRYTTFPDQDKSVLGFDSYFEIGAGLDYENNTKVFGLFGWRMTGLKFGIIGGDDVDGFSFGIRVE